MADAVVRIWWFTAIPAHKSLGAGHGSVELTNHEAYITWLGGDMRQQIVAGTWDFGDDFNHFGPDFETVRIPLRDQNTRCGLSKEGILRWWRVNKVLARPYHLLSKENNCDATVVSALRAGGAEVYVPSPINILYQGAATLLRWANDLRNRIQYLQPLIAGALQVLQAASREMWQPNTNGAYMPEIWTVAEWKTWSATTLGVRKQQVAAIDVLLSQYHTTAANVPAGGSAREHYHAEHFNSAVVARRLDTLYQILALAVDHLNTKPRSERRVAVMKLGRQVYDKIQELQESASALRYVAAAMVGIL